MANAQTNPLFYSTLVIEHIVPTGKDAEFKTWHTCLIKQASQFPGFLQVDLSPPLRCQDPVMKWYSIVHFDSPEHLNSWVNSGDRAILFESGQAILQAYRFKSFTTGLEGWFSNHSGNTEHTSLGPPPWKQILAVVLGLYPLVMLQSRLFSVLGVFKTWSPASAMLMSNLITSSILSLVVMPFIAGRLSFWLKPAYRVSSIKNDLLGGLLVAIALTILMVLFQHI
jgi:uncharacterized protein